MTLDSLTPLFASAVAAAIPLLLAALGELVTERSGVLNLGVEGMMLMGAVTAFVVVASGGGLTLATLCACAAGALAAFIFAVLTLTLQASQVATGLALAILGSGVSAFAGRGYVGNPAKVAFTELPIPVLSKLPLVGPALFSMNALGYLSVVLVAATTWFMYRTKSGLILRSVGESPVVAQSLGLQVIRIRLPGHHVRRPDGRPGRLLLRHRAVQDVAGGSHLRQRLDRPGPGGVRQLAPGAPDARRPAVWRG